MAGISITVFCAERLNQLREVTSQLFSSIDDVVENQWVIARTQRDYLMEYQPSTAGELIELMERQARINAFDVSKPEMTARNTTIPAIVWKTRSRR